MTKVIGIRFRKAGKVYYFSPGENEIKTGDHVIVETARGVEYGYVVLGTHEVDDKKVIQPLKPVIRMATLADEETERRNKEKEKEAFKVCVEKIKKHNLSMKLIDTEYTFDNNKVLFYFTADGRIDFRELVKDLASVFKTRIELRQIGVRDETKIVGGIGICGRPLCCASYLSEFIPVSIKMAKEQNLFLNPSKISGICGRLLCCLSYEQENYDIFHSSCPRLGKRYQTNKGPMKVLRANMFRNSVALLTDTNEELELTLDEWQALDPRRPDAPPRPEGKPDAKPENKPSSPRPHDELMVVMADPDTIDEAFGDESDELVDDLGGLNDGEMETLEEGLRPKRKRKRKR